MILSLLATPVFFTTPAIAVQPDEILDNPVLEARARTLSKGLRCLVCRNENIDDSDADLARDLRLLLRERLIRQNLVEMNMLIQSDLAGAGSQDSANLALVSQAVEKTLAVSDEKIKVTWQEELAALNDNQTLAQEISDRASQAASDPAYDAEVVGFIVDRYGEYVLLKPTTKGANLILWIAGPLMMLGALVIGGIYLRRRDQSAGQEPLSDAEKANLKEILNG